MTLYHLKYKDNENKYSIDIDSYKKYDIEWVDQISKRNAIYNKGYLFSSDTKSVVIDIDFKHTSFTAVVLCDELRILVRDNKIKCLLNDI